VVKPDIVVNPDGTNTNPFVVRLGVCYTSTGGTHPKFPAQKDQLFTITRGYKSYGQLQGNENDPDLQLYWNKLSGRYADANGAQNCHNLDDNERPGPGTDPSRNLDPKTGCPANGITALPKPGDADGGCPAPSVKKTWDPGTGSVTGCVFPKKTLTFVEHI